jgi:phenylacetate-CoA ligase
MNLRDFLAKYVFYPFVYELVQPNFNAYVEDREQIQFLKRDDSDAIQLNLLKKYLIFAYEKTKYYKKTFDDVGFNPYEFSELDEIKRIPILTKEIIRQNINDLMTAPEDELYKNTSGGSTGKPLIFYADKKYPEFASANAAVSDEFCGWYRGCRIARLWGHPNDYENALKPWVRLRYLLMNINYYDAFNMSEEKMEEYNKSLTQFSPDIILAYASSMHLFAKYLKKRGIKPNYPRLGIITSAEKLHSHMRIEINEVFNCQISDRYGSREVGNVGTECVEHKGMHLHPLDHYVESVGDSNSLLITTLTNHGMPFIRYEVGDLGELSDDYCTCGRNTRLLKSIVGRTSDIIKLSNGRMIHGEYFTHAFYFVRGVAAFQFIQHSYHDFEVRIVKDSEWNDSCLENVYKECNKVLDQNSDKIVINFVNEIPPVSSGKFRFTISEI